MFISQINENSAKALSVEWCSSSTENLSDAKSVAVLQSCPDTTRRHVSRHNHSSNHQRLSAVTRNFVCLYIEVHFVFVRCSLFVFFRSHPRLSFYSAPTTKRCWTRPSACHSRPIHLITPPHHRLLMPAIPGERLNPRLERAHHHPPFSLRFPTMNTKCNLSPTRSDILGLAAPSGDTPVCLVPCPTWRAFAQP